MISSRNAASAHARMTGWVGCDTAGNPGSTARLSGDGTLLRWCPGSSHARLPFGPEWDGFTLQALLSVNSWSTLSLSPAKQLFYVASFKACVDTRQSCHTRRTHGWGCDTVLCWRLWLQLYFEKKGKKKKIFLISNAFHERGDLKKKKVKKGSNKHVSSRGLLWRCPWEEAWVYLVMLARRAASFTGPPLSLCIAISHLLLPKLCSCRSFSRQKAHSVRVLPAGWGQASVPVCITPRWHPPPTCTRGHCYRAAGTPESCPSSSVEHTSTWQSLGTDRFSAPTDVFCSQTDTN